jgi:erythromycin esterase
MHKFFILSILLPLSLNCFAQKAVRAYVQENVVPIKNISPDSLDFSDLEVIGKAIGDSRIVMLGEQDHGDGAAMEAKTRLVKYLHERKGFDVLAFESDFFALNHGWEGLPKEKGAISRFLFRNVHPVWAESTQCQELLFGYIPATHKTNTPLQVTGFDNQGAGMSSRDSIGAFLDRYLRLKGINLGGGARHRQLLGQSRHLGRTSSEVKKEVDEAFVYLVDSLLAQLGPGAPQEFGHLVLENMREEAKMRIHADLPWDIRGHNIRDAQMARNLQWLSRHKYPQEKIIVWAANGHIAKNADTAIKPLKPYFYSLWGSRSSYIDWMGTAFTRDSLNARQTYVLGLVAKGGQRGSGLRGARLNTIPKPKRNSFDGWVTDSLDYGFVDFRPLRDLQPEYRGMFWMRAMVPAYMKGQWTNVFDGVFLIREMTPRGQVKQYPL